MITAQVTRRIPLLVTDFNKRQREVPPRGRNIALVSLVALCITVTSGVCSKALSLNHPIFVDKGAEKIAYVNPIQAQLEQRQIWLSKTTQKYPLNSLRYPTAGVAHVKVTRYINSKPIKLNIVEINPKANLNLQINPQTAGSKLNSRAQIRSIAKKQNGLVAVNAGYFKPQTGVPLGALMINGKVLTGPIYNRVGLGIVQKDGITSFVMDKVTMDIKIKTQGGDFKADNINQPRMLSTYTIIYTPEWGKMSPLAPKYGKVAAVVEGRVIGASANQIAIPDNGFVVSAPAKVIDELVKHKKIKYEITLPDTLKEAQHIIGAGPYLVKNGEIYVDVTEEKFGSITGRNPRSAVGFTKDNELIIVTVDGREQSSIGVTLGELARIMKGLGCVYAMNFDGGGSSVMYVNGAIVNTPAQKEGIGISNALVISEIEEPSET